MISQQQRSIESKTFATGYKESYAINLETTGLNPYTNQIIEIGSAKLVDGVDFDVLSSLK